MSFFTSIHCRSRAHCRACRSDPAWRARVAARHGLEVDFACPFGQDAAEADAGGSALGAAVRLAHGALSITKTAVGVDRAPDDLVQARLAVCEHCPGGHAIRREDGSLQSCGPLLAALTANGRAPCGCLLRHKARDRRESCPFGWWPALPADPAK